ncbi:hypothetical protein HERIO_682 [Hepatospora eriocheir]|uniref:Uncharacterized protein n=1 Tax=Hepatospora eriocheir TaxID=1081669 RepID=A0A1X0QCC7_9MICR|nr:hypothetical protein HERIO_682 [Hepatospora eriocheir]
MENEWSKLNDLKVGLDMASLALRPNIINMAAIYFNNGYYVVNFILLLLGFFSGFSLYILSESAAQLERYNYASLVGTAFSYKFILFCICVLKITRIIFTSNNLLAILSNYGLNKIVNDKISFLVMVFICYLLFSYYRKYYKYLALISGCTALLFTFTESVGSEYKFFRNEDGYIFNDLGILMLWLSSHHAVLSLYKFDMMQRRDRVISSFFSALIDILFYMGIGTFGIEAYPETESIWINNLENP